MTAGEFKQRCLTVIETVRTTREPILITKRGRPMVKVMPAGNPARRFLGRLEGMVRIVGDIESPLEPLKAWEAGDQ
jgi:prevent-host-death family protein